MSKRHIIQKKATNKIIKANYSGIILVAPRVGKSKIVLDALANVKSSILILAPFNSILDSWEVEINKWQPHLKEYIILANQRNIPKGRRYDYVICDECHTLSDNQVRNIKLLGCKNVLGLTGTISQSSKFKIRSILKRVIFEYSIKDAIKDEIISNYSIKVITLPLDRKDKYLDAGTINKPFKATEKGTYDYLTKQFNRFRVLSFKDKKYENIKYMYAGKRARMLYGAKSKIELTHKVIEKISEKKLIFTILTDVADQFAKHSYHSKIKEREDNLLLFKNGEIDKLAVCNMLSMGFTDKTLKVGIFHQLQSSEEQAQQKIMRMCNYVEGEIAEIYILVYEGTVDIDWVSKALEPFNKQKITYDSYRNWI